MPDVEDGETHGQVLFECGRCMVFVHFRAAVEPLLVHRPPEVERRRQADGAPGAEAAADPLGDVQHIVRRNAQRSAAAALPVTANQ